MTLAKSDTEYYNDAHYYAGIATMQRALDLEARGWQFWLLTLFPFWFEEDFSTDHEKYWALRWSVFQRIKAGEVVPNRELVALVLLGRGLGKSSVLEAARVMRGAMLNGGYSLFISETDDQAQEHMGNARILIEHPDSRLLDYYPNMAIADNDDALKGMPTADRKGMFICKNGYICRAKGLSAKMRGLRIGTRRPDDLCLDDIDDVNDSIMLSMNKERQVAASIIPIQARENVTIDVGQNLIAEHSLVNRIYQGRSDVLAERTVIGVTNAFSYLETETIFKDDGKMRHKILPTSVPSWSGLNIGRAQKFLDDSGMETFRAEYQNEFEQFKAGRVVPEYDEAVQVITWSDFERVFGTRKIPLHWQCKAGLDVGYSEGKYPHYSAWVFITTSAMNSFLPGYHFMYRGRSFKGVSIDDQAMAIKADLYENVTSWQMSHERTGEMLTLRQKYQLPFIKFEYYRKEDGVAQWRHLSKPDKKQPHPFKDDVLVAEGEYKLGSPRLFYIVDDDQVKAPRDDKGLRLFREQVPSWEFVTVKITANGQTVQQPAKINEDFCDAFKSTIALFGPRATELSMLEQFQAMIPKSDLIPWETVKAENRAPTLEEQTRQDFAMYQAQQKLAKRYGHRNGNDD
jgi:hypothetical protein